MSVNVIVLKTDGTVENKTYEDATLEVVQNLVGGLIQQVPWFDTYEGVPCQAWCDEEGKLKDYSDNSYATNLWYAQCPSARGHDHLVGDIVILTGTAMLD